MKRTLLSTTLLCWTLGCGVACAQALQQPATTGTGTAPPLAFAPFNGNHGYAEIALGPQSWYVAYHGNMQTSPQWLDAAWALRAAQLCQASQQAYFVRLRYVGEPVVTGAKLTAADDAAAPFSGLAADPFGDASSQLGYMVPAKSRGPVIIYTPVYNPPPMAFVPTNLPGRSEPILCVAQPRALKDPSRAVSVASTYEQAHVFQMTAR